MSGSVSGMARIVTWPASSRDATAAAPVRRTVDRRQARTLRGGMQG